MAGAVKHMERSHRSHHNSGYSVFNHFHAHAYTVAQVKSNRKTVLQRLASMLRPMAKGDR